MNDRKGSSKCEDERHTLVYGGWLFQQLHVGAYTCIEGNLFMWVRFNQHILKTELYKGLNGVIWIGFDLHVLVSFFRYRLILLAKSEV